MSLYITETTSSTGTGDTRVFDTGWVGGFCPVVTHLIMTTGVSGTGTGGTFAVDALFSRFAVCGIAGRDAKTSGGFADKTRLALSGEARVGFATTLNADITLVLAGLLLIAFSLFTQTCIADIAVGTVHVEFAALCDRDVEAPGVTGNRFSVVTDLNLKG